MSRPSFSERLRLEQEANNRSITEYKAEAKTSAVNRNKQVALGLLFGGAVATGFVLHGEAKEVVRHAEQSAAQIEFVGERAALPVDFVVDMAMFYAGVECLYRLGRGGIDEYERRIHIRSIDSCEKLGQSLAAVQQAYQAVQDAIDSTL